MATVLVDEIWGEIRRLAESADRKLAAVAYITHPSAVVFGGGDLLVVDASDASIMGGRTDPAVLRTFCDAGARVFSLPKLHAKLFVLGQVAVVGSTNISRSSLSTLIEAGAVLSSPESVRQASERIEQLAARGSVIDASYLDRAQELFVARPRVGEFDGCGVRWVPIYAQQVLPGDIRKYNASSSDSGTGGGARDLRVSPADRFEPLLRDLLPDPGGEDGITQGAVNWTGPDGRHGNSILELWPPTPARQSELRLARFYEVGGWAVSEEELQRRSAAGERLFYVLEVTPRGRRVARIATEQQLRAESPQLGQLIEARSASTADGHAVRVGLDRATGVGLP